jgi:hypothetical protein
VESFFGKLSSSASSVAVETAPQCVKVLRNGHVRTPPGVSMHCLHRAAPVPAASVAQAGTGEAGIYPRRISSGSRLWPKSCFLFEISPVFPKY